MNRLLILILVCIAYAMQMNAQIGEARSELSVGVNGGVNLSSVSFIPSFKQATKQGMVGGVTLRHISEKYFALLCGIQVEANYSEVGWKTMKDIGETRQSERTLRYIEVPFLAHVAFGNENGLLGFVHAGPQVGYLIGESSKMTDDYLPASTENYQNGEKALLEPITNKFDYGIAAGLGVELHTKRLGSFIVEGRYYMGLADFCDNGKTAIFQRSAHRNITIKATYLFRLKD